MRACRRRSARARARPGRARPGARARRQARSRVAVPLVAGDELLGLLVARGNAQPSSSRARSASQTAVGIKKIQLIERLTEKNLIKDFFEDLAARATSAPMSKAVQRGSVAISICRTSCSPPSRPTRRSSRALAALLPGLAVRPARRLAPRAAARAAGAGRRG